MEIRTNLQQMDLDAVLPFSFRTFRLGKGLPRAVFDKSLQHSLCFAGWDQGQQVAFARVITDHTTFAYLVDVYVEENVRGRGYSKLLMQQLLAHPELQHLRRFVLVSSSARGLYQQFGFSALAKPETYMEI
jgi:predicted GNAT family N-acyltransferase